MNNLTDSTHLIWIDLEMTGLDCERDRILEIATVVTDKNLHVLAEGPVIAIHQDDDILVSMDDWNKSHHGQSGLTERVRRSYINEDEAQAQTLAFLNQYVPAGKSPMCGNTVCQDRRFLFRFMPKLEQHFHYRHLDVSTLKILAQLWAPEIYASIQKQSTHVALADIYDSINELKHYRQYLFNL